MNELVVQWPSTLIVMTAALIGGAAAGGAARLEAPAMHEAQELMVAGVIWTGGTPVLMCIAGALGGSLISVGLELYFHDLYCSRHPKDRMGHNSVTPWKLCLKFFMQPIFAMIFTSPMIYWTGLPFTVETVLLVSFLIGLSGVYLIRLLIPSVPAFIGWVVPAFGRRVVRLIDPLSAYEIDKIRMGNYGLGMKPKPVRRKRPVRKKKPPDEPPARRRPTPPPPPRKKTRRR